MAKIYFMFFALIFISISWGTESLDMTFSKDYFVQEAVFKKDAIGLIVKRGSGKETHFFHLIRKSNTVAEIDLEKFKKIFTLKDDQIEKHKIIPTHKENKYTTVEGQEISYTLNNCLQKEKTEKEYLSRDYTCKSATFNINGKSVVYDKDPFYTWERFTDPVIWRNFLIFKNYVVTNYSADTDRIYPEHISGFVVFSLDSKRRFPIPTDESKFFSSVSIFSNNFISLLKLDTFESFLWVGSNYGFYGLDEKLNEKISCYFIKDNTAALKMLRCARADYLQDNKADQAILLQKKEDALIGEKLPPEDRQKKMNSYALCIRNLDYNYYQSYLQDKDKNKDFNSKYNKIIKCSLLGPDNQRQNAERLLKEIRRLENTIKQ